MNNRVVSQKPEHDYLVEQINKALADIEYNVKVAQSTANQAAVKKDAGS